jgi:hypothetical protein
MIMILCVEVLFVAVEVGGGAIPRALFVRECCYLLLAVSRK